MTGWADPDPQQELDLTTSAIALTEAIHNGDFDTAVHLLNDQDTDLIRGIAFALACRLAFTLETQPDPNLATAYLDDWRTRALDAYLADE